MLPAVYIVFSSFFLFSLFFIWYYYSLFCLVSLVDITCIVTVIMYLFGFFFSLPSTFSWFYYSCAPLRWPRCHMAPLSAAAAAPAEQPRRGSARHSREDHGQLPLFIYMPEVDVLTHAPICRAWALRPDLRRERSSGTSQTVRQLCEYISIFKGFRCVMNVLYVKCICLYRCPISKLNNLYFLNKKL